MQNLIPTNPLDNLTRIEYKGQPVLTTAQLAAALSTPDKVVTAQNLIYNFKYNASRYVEGKHYFKLEGEELITFKNIIGNSNDVVSPRSARLMLWTRRGVARHCKSVNTNIAWDVYEVLEDTYFNVEQIIRNLKKPSEENKELARITCKLASHADDPYEKRKLVVKAANLLFGEEFLPTPSKPVEQLSLFYVK